MDTVRVTWRAGLTLLAGLAAASALSAAPLPKEVDETQRRRALALNDVTGEDPIEGHVKLLHDDPAGTRKLLATAVVMAAKEKAAPFNYNAAYILARAADDLKDVDAGRTFYRICVAEARKLKSSHKLSQAYGGLILLLYEHKKYAESEKVCKEILELAESDEQLRLSRSRILEIMIRSIAKQGKADQAMKLVDDYAKASKGNVRALELRGLVLYEVGRMADAAKAYETLLDRLGKDKSLEGDDTSDLAERCHYTLSGIYVDLHKVDKAAEHLKTLLQQKPDSPTYNNDLGYIWADHNMNLGEAEKLIRKAIEEDRKQRKKENPDAKPEEDQDNAAYLDSLGWVLFKQKKYKEAKEPLQKACEMPDGQHVEILDHLAEVQLKLGEKSAAAATWKKALGLTVESKREQERKKQVEKKLKAVEAKESKD